MEYIAISMPYVSFFLLFPFQRSINMLKIIDLESRTLRVVYIYYD